MLLSIFVDLLHTGYHFSELGTIGLVTLKRIIIPQRILPVQLPNLHNEGQVGYPVVIVGWSISTLYLPFQSLVESLSQMLSLAVVVKPLMIFTTQPRI